MNVVSRKIMTAKERIKTIIFGTDTPAGKAFDIILIICIVLSVLVVILDSVKAIHLKYCILIHCIEWFFTVIFTIEYTLRIYCVNKKSKYIFSYFGIIDFLAILPSYLSILIPGTHSLLVIKLLRILRVFRILKLASFIEEVNDILTVLKSCSRRIFIFILTVLTCVTILGTLMYTVETQHSGFTSIPQSIYWAIVTLTTVGYGDISPDTPLGQAIAAIIMILGYSIIVVPTGFVSVAISTEIQKNKEKKICPFCNKKGHDEDAVFCKYCGNNM